MKFKFGPKADRCAADRLLDRLRDGRASPSGQLIGEALRLTGDADEQLLRELRAEEAQMARRPYEALRQAHG